MGVKNLLKANSESDAIKIMAPKHTNRKLDPDTLFFLFSAKITIKTIVQVYTNTGPANTSRFGKSK